MKKLKWIISATLMAVSVACLATACGEAAAPEAHTHTFESGWEYNETYHYHKASCSHTDKTSGKEAHSFTVSVVEPSCLTSGYTLHACACGYSYKTDEHGTPTGHVMVTHAAQAATCSLDGWESYTACANCGYEEGTHNTYPATGNHNVVHHGAQAPTHEADGWKAYDVCSQCGEYLTKFEAISSESVHTYDGDTCTVCEHTYLPSQKLQFVEKNGSYTVKGIGDYTESVVRIPRTHNDMAVTAIEEGAFKRNATITEIVIPGSVKTIGREAFYGCENLTEISFTSEGTNEIGVAAFAHCTGVEEVVLSDSITTIKEHAFQECTSMESIHLPTALANMNYQVFLGCTALTGITIPAKLEVIDYNMFMNCTALSNVTFAGGKVSVIKWKAFYGCTSLESISFPAALKEIGQSAFENSGLKTLTITSSVNYIGTAAFKGCTFTTVTFVNTSGWVIANRTDGAVSATDLADSAKAITLLTSTHVNVYWKRG